MQVHIPYGKEKIKVNIPGSCEVLEPNKVRVRDEHKIIETALKNPIGRKSFEEFAAQADRLLVIVNDATRPTPTAKILEFLYPVLSSHPDVRLLIATGVHRAPTNEEYRYIFGRFYDDFREQIYVHDARISPICY